MAHATITVDGVTIPFDVRTLDGFRSWYASLEDDAAVRGSFCDGEVFLEMTPQSHRSHEPLASEINSVLRQLARETGLGRYFYPPSWFTDAGGGLSTEPDGFLVGWESFATKRVALNPQRETELVGAPDMVLEVVSKTSAKKDHVSLRAGSARAKVREYWIADARDGKASLQVLTLASDAAKDADPWRDVLAGPDGYVASPLWGRSFRLDRFVDRAGLDDFKLAVR